MLKQVARFLAAPVLRSPTARIMQGLIRGRIPYHHFGMITEATADFQNEPRFRRSYAAAEATGSWNGADPVWNCYIACWAAAHAAKLPGDFVECGVNRGAISLAVAKYVEFASLSKTFFLLDTFEGGDPGQLNAVERSLFGTKYTAGAGYYWDCFEDVKKTFSEYDNVHLVRGRIPESLAQVSTDAISYLSIDMNCREPEIAAAEFFWDKLVAGGIILLDDYGWPAHRSQKEGFDEFAASKGVEVLSLPTGQGLILKPTS